MTSKNTSQDPNSEKYNFKKAHPEENENSIKLFPQEISYLKSRGFDIIYDLNKKQQKQIQNYHQLPQKEISPFHLGLKPYSQDPNTRGPQLYTHSISFSHTGSWYPHTKSQDKLITHIESLILTAHRHLHQDEKQGPIPILVSDTLWLNVINQLKSKYNSEEYKITEP